MNSVTAREDLQARVAVEAQRRGVAAEDLMNRVVEAGLAHLPGEAAGAVGGQWGGEQGGIGASPGILGSPADSDLPAFLRKQPDPTREKREQQQAEAEAERFRRWADGHKRGAPIMPLESMSREYIYEERG